MRTMPRGRASIPIAAGFTLTELMLSLTLGLIMVLATTGLVVATRMVQSTQFAAASLQETGQFALNNIARSVKQAGFINVDRNDAPVIVTASMSPSIVGLDDATLGATVHGIDNPAKSTNYASDVLAVRFFGSGTKTPDDSILNCGGFGVPAPTSQANAEQDRGWSIYYVANDSKGIPNLYCKYNNARFTAQSIAEGVEAFQVLYGIDTGKEPAITHQFLNAGAINALDAGIPVADLNRRTSWKKITAVKIALLIRSENKVGGSGGTAPAVYDLFGPGYNQSGGALDPGSQILRDTIPQEQKGKIRKIIGTTIQLRNSVR